MAPKNEYICIIPDKPGTLETRFAVRPQHLENIKPLVEAGLVFMGGAMLDSHPVEGQTPPVNGSIVMYVGESKDEVLDLIRKDIYTTSGVWDLDKVQIIPFKSAVRVSM
ncbi:hypothetical protein EYZ11_006067 [Aspergillus tanneri]|uniref:YCII-related domain-containing protein n=1 Tax=Aspergillus tanneri TaxID=1220188 RepID=A0A4V3UPH9_9EURO|nr:uncharacterized protein ATNIH1004_005049 [Aspergillus tanneri]KAA8649154.1 hypothetical protein ATNIH1004_005049 [Aspergillus tanneri]THC94464.1 hypothetical protein EYZ11_006067 [Aspergillus tanneri]